MKTYSVEQIARSYQGSHVVIANMPSDDELLHALTVNGHGADQLDTLKNEYRRISLVVAPYLNKMWRKPAHWKEDDEDTASERAFEAKS